MCVGRAARRRVKFSILYPVRTGGVRAVSAESSNRPRASAACAAFTTPGRKRWDVTFHELHVAIQPNDGSIAGYNGIPGKVLEPATEMQIDLMEPLCGAEGGGRDESSVIDQSA